MNGAAESLNDIVCTLYLFWKSELTISHKKSSYLCPDEKYLSNNIITFDLTLSFIWALQVELRNKKATIIIAALLVFIYVVMRHLRVIIDP